MFTGKTALVTGATSGIGLTIARTLAAQGANLIINGLGDAAALQRLRQEIAATHGVRVMVDASDLSRPKAIETMVEMAIEQFDRVDLLVNNAGIQHVAPIDEFPVERWDAILALNLSASFHTTRLLLPGMRSRGFGRIVNVASAHALVASPYKSAYVAAKHGVAGLTKTVALEAAASGVTVNAVCPGYVLTPLVQQQIPQTAAARGISEEAVVRDVLLAAQPTRRFVTVEQVASLVAYLCSDDAASITGAVLPMDGGWTAQ
jgi:3-hydroxybutyrate dehydrogenase